MFGIYVASNIGNKNQLRFICIVTLKNVRRTRVKKTERERERSSCASWRAWHLLKINKSKSEWNGAVNAKILTFIFIRITCCLWRAHKNSIRDGVQSIAHAPNNSYILITRRKTTAIEHRTFFLTGWLFP